MAATVDWEVARRVAGRVASDDHFAGSYLATSLERDMLELTAQAEKLVEAETGLVSLAGPARAKVTDRMGWVDANLASFDRLLRPLLQKFEKEPSDGEPGALGQLWAPVANAIRPVTSAVGPKVAGTEVGALLGWMSGRVLGQYDLLVIEDERPEEQDLVYYVGPNVLSLEKRYGFPPQEFRLWIAIHECTHRAQFTGVEWLRPHFLSLVQELLEAVDPDPKRMAETLKAAVEAKRSGQQGLLDNGGLGALFASPEQKVIMEKMSGLMSLLEGHGDIVMDRAGKDLIPSQPRFARVLSQRRSNSSGPAKLIQRMLGLEAKMAQYAEGEDFVKAVETAGGMDLFNKVWEGPEMLPTLAEIRDPQLWIDRVNASAAA